MTDTLKEYLDDFSWYEAYGEQSTLPASDLVKKTQTTAFELDLAERVQHLSYICYHPRQVLQTELTKRNASQVRRIVPKTITHLSQHNEDWQAVIGSECHPASINHTIL